MRWWEWTLICSYGAVSLCLFVYAFHMYVMVALFVIARLRRKPPAPAPPESELPSVTVQIPLYNEKWVARRVIQAACAQDYPPHLLDIQVLDDSTDETRGIVDEEVALQRAKGIRIEAVRRPDRSEFKAGALKYGLASSRGELVAIFDADFVPPPSWLRAVVPELVADPKVGWVQTRWGHLNGEDSWLTRAQSIGIDGHFGIEQVARTGTGLLANFNGTAGIWRRAAIDDAGGWAGDTLTEDLDLSYRAQLRGWKMRYRPDIAVPAEVPAEPSAVKSQQFRWAKGSMQTARKHLGGLWRSRIGLFRKLMATIHLTSYAIHPFMLLSVILTFPMLLLVGRPIPYFWLVAGSLMFMIGTGAPFVMYTVSQLALGSFTLRRIATLPILMSLGMAISLSTTRAIIEALMGRPSAFVRTPKRGEGKRHSGYAVASSAGLAEIAMGIACAIGAALYSRATYYPVAILMGIYACGFASLGILTCHEQWVRSRLPGGQPQALRAKEAVESEP